METSDHELSIDSPNLFFEKAPVGYLVLDKQGMILQVNEKICQLLKCDKSDLINCSLSDFISQEDLSVYNKNYKSFYRKPTERKLELRLTKDNMTFHYCQLIGSKVKLPISEIKSKDVLLVSVIDITDLYRQRQESESSEKQFETLFNHSAVGIAIVKVDGFFIKLNKRFSEITGYSKTELESMDFRTITHPDDIKLDDEFIVELMTGKRDSFELDKRYIKKNGEIVWIRLYSSVVRDKSGYPQYAIATITDISLEKCIYQEKEEKQQKLELAMSSAHEGLWEWDFELGEVHFDENAIKMLGFSKQFIRSGDWWINRIHPADKEVMENLIEQYLQGKTEKYQAEFRMQHKDGSYCWIQSHGSIIQRFENCDPKLFVGIHRDVSIRKQRQQKLHEYEYIFDSIQEPISILDSEYKYQKVNKAFLQYYKKSLEDIEDHYIWEVIGNKLFENQLKPYIDRCLRGEVVNNLSWFEIADNKPMFLDMKFYPFYNEAGEVNRIVISSNNLTSMKKAEKKSVQTENLMEQIFNVTIPLCLINNDYEITRVNETFCKLFSKTRSILIGQKCNEALCLDACNSPGCLMKKMLSGAQRSNYLMELQTKETGKRNIVISSQAIYDESKQLSGIIECFTDITELQWAEQELLSKGKEITKKNAELQAQNAELQKVELEQKSIIQRLEKAEVMLKESNDRYQLLSEVTFEGILIHHNGIAIDANNRFFNMTGFDRSDIPGLDVFDIVSEKDKEKARENILKAYAGPYQMDILRKDGSSFLAEIESCHMEYKDNTIRISAIRDISEKIKMEKQLALSEHKFKFYIDNAPSGFFAIDKKGNYLEVNQAFCEITGYSESELLGMGLPDIIHPSSIEKEFEHFDNLRKEGISSRLITFISKDGEKRVWNEIGKKLTDGRYIAFTQDVTEQIKAQERVKRSEKLLKFAIAQMPIPVMITGVTGTSKLLYNQLASDLVHYRPNLVGETILPGNHKILPMLLPDRSQIKTKDLPLSKAILQGISTHNQDMIIPHPEGDRWISANAEPLRDEHGNIIAGIVVFPEITARIKLENKLRENQRLLNEVEKLARIGGWEIDVITRKSTWTKGTYDIVEIPYSDHIPDMHEHVDYYLAEYREMINQRISDLINNDIPLEYEAEFITEQGNIRCGRTVGIREMKDGKCLRIYGTLQDITQQKQLEKVIRSKTAQMESILNNTSDFILLGDKDCKPVYYNSAYRQMMEAALGLEVKQGDPPHTHLNSKKEKAYWEGLHKRVLSGESFMAQYSLPYLDGKVHYLELSYSPVIENGKINGFSEVTRDITERKMSELEVIESEEKYRILAETLQHIIITHDLEGKIQYINQYGVDYICKSREELIGSSIDQFLTASEKMERIEIINEMINSDEPKHNFINLDFIKTDGKKRVLELNTSPILKELKLSGILIIARDVTDRLQAEAELAKHRLHLEQLVKDRTAELEEQKAELERFNKLYVGREFRIKELRDKVKALKNDLIAHGVKLEDDDEFLH